MIGRLIAAAICTALGTPLCLLIAVELQGWPWSRAAVLTLGLVLLVQLPLWSWIERRARLERDELLREAPDTGSDLPTTILTGPPPRPVRRVR